MATSTVVGPPWPLVATESWVLLAGALAAPESATAAMFEDSSRAWEILYDIGSFDGIFEEKRGELKELDGRNTRCNVEIDGRAWGIE